MDKSTQVLSELTVFGKYAKYIPSEERRESWDEIVHRYTNMMIDKYPQLKSEILDQSSYILNKKILPSMRALQFSGLPIDRNPSRVYNCAYLPLDDYRSFSEAMFLLLGGTGVGYSVQYAHIDKLPEITKPTKNKRFLVGDSIEGWADSVKILMKSYLGKNSAKPVFDFRDIRPKGARLKTAGGKAPGAEPLKTCLFNIETILERKQNGEKLTDIECHDIMCHIANAVLAGGIRRAAMICLFSFDSQAMLAAKSNFNIISYSPVKIERLIPNTETYELVDSVHIDEKSNKKYFDINVTVDEPFYGIKETTCYWISEEDYSKLKSDNILPWYCFQEQRGRANNSAVIVRNRITLDEWQKLWKKIEASGSGEPGVYFTNDANWGTNPCCEIALRPYQFCNLTEVNVSDIESQEDLHARVAAAAFFGTLQAGFTDFHYLRDIWKKTTEKDALIGVGMTGIGSGVILKYDLEKAAKLAKDINEEVAKIIGINSAARVTTVKPSGTSSCVLGTSSGIHAWHNNYYLRSIRLNKNESLYTYLSINAPELLEDDFFRPDTLALVRVPQKAPDNAILRTESALDLLERTKLFNLEWVKQGHRSGANTNNVSATISISKDRYYKNPFNELILPFECTKEQYENTNFGSTEWEVVGNWMWENRHTFNGLSVLPYDNGTYVQAPFEDITEEEYNKRVKTLSNIDLTKVIEIDDNTEHNQEAACAGGKCEI